MVWLIAVLNIYDSVIRGSWRYWINFAMSCAGSSCRRALVSYFNEYYEASVDDDGCVMDIFQEIIPNCCLSFIPLLLLCIFYCSNNVSCVILGTSPV